MVPTLTNMPFPLQGGNFRYSAQYVTALNSNPNLTAEKIDSHRNTTSEPAYDASHLIYIVKPFADSMFTFIYVSWVQMVLSRLKLNVLNVLLKIIICRCRTISLIQLYSSIIYKI